LESNWRYNVAEQGFTGSEIRLAARSLVFPTDWYWASIEPRNWAWQIQFLVDPFTGLLSWAGFEHVGLTMTDVWRNGWCEDD